MSSYAQRLNAIQKQALGQILSPQMQRSMHLLQLSRDELEREIAEICEANPVIDELPSWSRKTGSRDGLSNWSASAKAVTGLSDHLAQQLALSRASKSVKATAARIIAHITPNGRLPSEDWGELSRAPHAAAALTLVQSFEPCGIAARSLAECFALQLDAARANCPGWRALLANLDGFATEPARMLAKKCAVSESVLGAMIAHLRTLDPYPGRQFEIAERIEITPDLLAKRTQSGEWAVGLTWNPSNCIATAPAYRGWQEDNALPGAARTFLAEKQEEADWLKRALKQRGQTLLRVARLAIARQDLFLSDGPEHLVPLTMREIAARLDLHESTVSRAVANKYILTPGGVIPVRSLFSTALSEHIDHAETSSAAVRARIGKMIGEEASPGALSDSAISEALKMAGVTIARRSVAKHREQLGLGSARERARLASYAATAE